MSIPIKIPELPNDIGDVKVANVHVDVGDIVLVNSPLFDIETDKTILEILASEAGEIRDFKAKVGDYVTSNQVIGTIIPVENAEVRRVHSMPTKNDAPIYVSPPDKKRNNHQVKILNKHNILSLHWALRAIVVRVHLLHFQCFRVLLAQYFPDKNKIVTTIGNYYFRKCCPLIPLFTVREA